jgi:hypothetical protein
MEGTYWAPRLFALPGGRRRRDRCMNHCRLPTDHNSARQQVGNQGSRGYVHDPLSVVTNGSKFVTSPYNQNRGGYVHDPLPVVTNGSSIVIEVRTTRNRGGIRTRSIVSCCQRIKIRCQRSVQPGTGEEDTYNPLSVVANGSKFAARGPYNQEPEEGGSWQRGGFGSAGWDTNFRFLLRKRRLFYSLSSLDMNFGTIERFAPLRGDGGKFLEKCLMKFLRTEM